MFRDWVVNLIFSDWLVNLMEVINRLRSHVLTIFFVLAILFSTIRAACSLPRWALADTRSGRQPLLSYQPEESITRQ